jgi:hypothetical protein
MPNFLSFFLRGIQFTQVQCANGSEVQLMTFLKMSFLLKIFTIQYLWLINVRRSRMFDGVWCAHFSIVKTTVMDKLWMNALNACALYKQECNTM